MKQKFKIVTHIYNLKFLQNIIHSERKSMVVGQISLIYIWNYYAMFRKRTNKIGIDDNKKVYILKIWTANYSRTKIFVRGCYIGSHSFW